MASEFNQNRCELRYSHLRVCPGGKVVRQEEKNIAASLFRQAHGVRRKDEVQTTHVSGNRTNSSERQQAMPKATYD